MIKKLETQVKKGNANLVLLGIEPNFPSQE